MNKKYGVLALMLLLTGAAQFIDARHWRRGGGWGRHYRHRPYSGWRHRRNYYPYGWGLGYPWWYYNTKLDTL